MKFQIVIAAVALLVGSAVSASAQAVTLQFDNGRVTLNAQNAQLRTILDEWSRLGGTRFVNAERLGGAPVSLELTAMPERQALEILLRAVAGYVVTQRDQTTGLSRLGGVIILPTSNAVRNPAPVTFGATSVQQRSALDDGRDDQDADLPQAGQRLPTPVNPFTATPGTTATPGVVRVVTPTPTAAPFGSVTETQQGSSTPFRPPTTVQTLPGGSRPGEISPQPQQPQAQPNQR